MNTDLVKVLILSLLITTGISAALGFALYPIFGGFLNAFVFSFLLQLIGNYFYNDYRIKKIAREEEEILNKRLEILSRNLVKFNCPCGENEFEEVIYPSLDNIFSCEKCNQSIKMQITYTPVIVTKELTSNPLEKIQNISGSL